MSNEGTLTVFLKLAKGQRKFQFDPATLAYDWAGVGFVGPTSQLMTDSYAAITGGKGSIGSLGDMVVMNPALRHDGTTANTAYISISLDAGSTEHLRILPGKFAIIPLPPALDVATNLRVKASVTNVADLVFGFTEV